MDNKYIGREEQIYGVEEVRLVGGRGDGMRLYQVRNGNGLEITVSLDRCADLSRITFKGDNMGYFSPCGYVAPSFYDKEGAGFLKSFTAGFMTTCGLTNVGNPTVDEGEVLPLHGNAAQLPSEHNSWWIEKDEIHIKAVMRDTAIFNRMLVLEREYIIPLLGNSIKLIDKITNIGANEEPFQMLYHCNLGYPLLDEDTVLNIPYVTAEARDEHAQTGFDRRINMEKPQAGYKEMCYFYTLDGKVNVSVYQPKIKRKVTFSYDSNVLPCLTEWKMMGEREYVLGIEPGNAYPAPRDLVRKNGELKFIKPGETKEHTIEWIFTEE